MKQVIGKVGDIEELGKGLLFTCRSLATGEELPAFVIKFDGQYFAYLNRCGHIAVQLDYMPGEFFSDEGDTLVCATHGAEYAPDTGACLGGPCFGVGLDQLAVQISDDELVLTSDKYELVSTPRGK